MAPEAPQRGAPDRVRMPLLTLITQQSLDEDYVHVAERRAAAGEPPREPPRIRHGTAAVAILLFGVMVATAAVQTSRNADTESASRATLLERIEQRRTAVADQQERIAELGDVNAELDRELDQVEARVSDSRAEVTGLRTRGGAGPVTGPGVRFTLRDSPDGTFDGRVKATDLRLLINGLWQAGAEAISVNGHRLSAISAVTTSGESVIVHGTPLSPPYVVQAIGDRRTLQAELFGTTSGVRLQATAQTFGFLIDRQNDATMRLPATPPRELVVRYAKIGSSKDRPSEPPREEATP